MPKLVEFTEVFRTKNAEPFITTFDLFFKDKESYDRVKGSGVITPEKVAETYNIPIEAVYGIYFIDNVNAMKLSIYKYGPNGYMASGDPENPDSQGTQQHILLMNIEI